MNSRGRRKSVYLAFIIISCELLSVLQKSENSNVLQEPPMGSHGCCNHCFQLPFVQEMRIKITHVTGEPETSLSLNFFMEIVAPLYLHISSQAEREQCMMHSYVICSYSVRNAQLTKTGMGPSCGQCQPGPPAQQTVSSVYTWGRQPGQGLDLGKGWTQASVAWLRTQVSRFYLLIRLLEQVTELSSSCDDFIRVPSNLTFRGVSNLLPLNFSWLLQDILFQEDLL